MTTLPRVWAFQVRISPSRAADVPAQPARFATAGRYVTVEAKEHTSRWTGTAVVPETGADVHLASAEGVGLLMAGELYNREALAEAAGEGSVPADDAELLLGCWLRYDVSTFRLVNGRFAAVVSEGSRVAVTTDHAAGIPLYLRVSDLGVDVATEAKSLVGEVPGPRRIPGAVPVHEPSGLHRVPAGTTLVVDLERTAAADAGTTVVRTWAPPYSRTILRPDEAVRAVRERLSAAVTERVAGDREPTVVLSGGVDSSAVAALSMATAGRATTVSLGTDAGDEFDAARLVKEHIGSRHVELELSGEALVRRLPWAVWAAELVDPDVLEYLLPLVALYQRLTGPPRRILTGYGADIPLGGMHRETRRLASLDGVIAHDMDTFDGLNEMSPVLSGVAGHWSTHPYWDRDLLDLLVSLEPGLKRREGRDKWVLRRAVADILPAETVGRAKLGIHEGSGTTSLWTRVLRDAGVPEAGVPDAKRAMSRWLYERVVIDGAHPSEVSVHDALASYPIESAKGVSA